MTNRLRALFCDHLSMMRGKYLPASKIGDDASRFAQALFAVHYDRDLLPSPGSMMMEGLPEEVTQKIAAEVPYGASAAIRINISEKYIYKTITKASHPQKVCEDTSSILSPNQKSKKRK